MKKSYEETGREIGENTYPILSEDDQAIIAFGMIPLELEEMVERIARERFAKIGLLAIGCNPDDQTLDAEGKTILQVWSAAIDKDQIQEVLRGFTLGLYAAAKANKKMLV